MLKVLFAAVIFVLFTAGINAQSEDCATKCSKETKEVSKDSKHCDVPETVSTDGKNTEVVAGALLEKESTVVTKEVKVTEQKGEVKVTEHSDAHKDEKGCCSTDKTKTDDPKK